MVFISFGSVGVELLQQAIKVMANTYTQLYVHIVFAVKDRACLVAQSWKSRIERYIAGVINNRGHKLYIINAQPDHVHLLVSLDPNDALSDAVRDIKSSSSRFINEEKLVHGHFQWQEGYGAFSCSQSSVARVVEYIKNQDSHHGSRSFIDEYRILLRKYDIAFDEQYIFKAVENS